MTVCGNAILEGLEECDDGNTVEGDRCAPDCTIEHPDDCPGTAIHVALGQTITLNDTTVGANDTWGKTSTAGAGNCTNGTWPGPDLIYQVMPQETGTLEITFTTQLNYGFVHVRSGCPASSAEQVACEFKFGGGAIMVSFAVTKGVSYYVAADSVMNTAGPFTLSLALK